VSGRPILVGGRTTYRTINGERGLEPLAAALELGEPLVVGQIGADCGDRYEEDLASGHATLVAAGEAVRDALAAGERPVVVASDCSVCVSTLPAAAGIVEDLHVLWLDAHGDFNTPDTTPSKFLGGMCLAAACGRWDAGFEPSIEPARVLMCGVRDLDAGERVLVETAGVGNARPSEVVRYLQGRRVYVHLDLDVLDPDVLPAQFAVPHGLSETGLRTLLSDVASECDVVGVEVTAFEAPEDPGELVNRTELVASIVRALLP
jgi:arginase